MATVTIDELSGTERLVLEAIDNRNADVPECPEGLRKAIETLRSIIAAFDRFQEPEITSDPSPKTSVRQRLIFRWADHDELPQLQAVGWSIARRGTYPGSWLLCREDSFFPSGPESQKEQ